ncbi:MAG: GNAT family N-acetyltransferase [Puniceicoccaceae bacterium]|nr:MAG: GNAT family N-acetyltransferase [Puniceicoccaceae bacterium]
MTALKRLRDTTIEPTHYRGILQLLQATWPSQEFNLENALQAFLEERTVRRSVPDFQRRRRYIIMTDDRVAAHAITFPRTILTTGGPVEVTALAGVCVAPDLRGGGLGRQVVAAAFADQPETGTAICLFQTGVPGFYRRLGATEVHNTFINGRHPEGSIANPWWDEWVMVFPADGPWPAGRIDLNGPAW